MSTSVQSGTHSEDVGMDNLLSFFTIIGATNPNSLMDRVLGGVRDV